MLSVLLLLYGLSQGRQGCAHITNVPFGPVPSATTRRIAEPCARILRVRRVGGDLSRFCLVLPLGDPPRQVDHTAWGDLVS